MIIAEIGVINIDLFYVFHFKKVPIAEAFGEFYDNVKFIRECWIFQDLVHRMHLHRDRHPVCEVAKDASHLVFFVVGRVIYDSHLCYLSL